MVLLDERPQLGLVFFRHLACNHTVCVELPPVGQINDAAGHPGACVPTDRAEGDRHTTGHVLAEVITRAFNHRHRA